MGLLFLFLAFSLLLAPVSPLPDAPHNSCSTTVLDDELSVVNGSGLHFTLHHPMHPCSPAPLAPSSSVPFSDVLAADESRVQSFAARLTKTVTRPSSPLLQPDAVSVPLSPGTSFGVGNYVTRIGLGTPAKSYAMVVDTGSSLTWLQCSPCRISCHSQVGPVFDPATSGTYRSLSCSAPECAELETATLNPSGCSRSNVCIYQASYGDSSFSVGYLSRDTLSIGGQSFPGFVYGCGQDNEGLFGHTAGLIGLARNGLSLLSQLAPRIGNSFSYCLPTEESVGYLSVGSSNPGQYSYTPLVSSSLDNSLYFIKITAITVAGKSLPISPSTYSSTPTIIDSGTVVTRLPPDVYDALSDAVAGALKGHARAPAYSILDTCFKGSLKALPVLEVNVVFLGGATLRLAPRNVLIDVDDSTTCLAFAPAGSVAIFGNIQQQTFRVAYDVAGSKIGFGTAGCG